jgi:AmmeMemoRadiSam system protein B/AmmeMemoRadiSam system protein A
MAAVPLEPVAGDTKQKIRRPAVAGSFYPADPEELAQTVDDLLAGAPAREIEGDLVALISPHAGYVYSGHVAAHGYSLLRGRGIRRVVVISPSHLGAFPGIAVFDGDAYETPLGMVPVDKRFARRLADSHMFLRLSGYGHDWREGYRGEHALEVQLPFLQRALGDFELVPVVMGDQGYEACRVLGRELARLIHGRETLVIASSDLSHFHPYHEAVELDKKVTDAVQRWDFYSLSRNFQEDRWEACGGGPVVACLIAAEQLGASRSTLFRYANSGDVPAGDNNRVVGYASVGLIDDGTRARIGDTVDFELTAEEKKQLLHIARASAESAVRTGKTIETGKATGILGEQLGAFVTLEIDGQLRGCIGYTIPHQSLQETVRDVAAFAAIRDSRFPPVSESELGLLEYEISVLSPLRHVTDIKQIEVGRHGLLIKQSQVEGLLLPQVAADRGWDTRTFLEATCRKARLEKDAWKNDITDIYAFTAVVFREHDIH